MYLIEILHQTTTKRRKNRPKNRCILSKFYIKPQQRFEVEIPNPVVSYRNSTSNHNYLHRRYWQQRVVSYRNSTSNHNTKSIRVSRPPVVSYRNSTSNHNDVSKSALALRLYLIEILHQTTTQSQSAYPNCGCILSKFYIKPQLVSSIIAALAGCILSKFYIKPQQAARSDRRTACCILSKFYIKPQLLPFVMQRLIRCILSKFYIKPQPSFRSAITQHGCILSKFYIKPQLSLEVMLTQESCILSKFYIKPQLVIQLNVTAWVVSYRNSTSNHNLIPRMCFSQALYLIEILHQTTTTTSAKCRPFCCILSKFYIKPQRRHATTPRRTRCILSKFYIKPQRRASY